MKNLSDIIPAIVAINSKRNSDTLFLRNLKLQEEWGELCSAYYSYCSKDYKNLSWNDIAEELVDLMIMAVDIAFTPPLPINVNAWNEMWNSAIYDGKEDLDFDKQFIRIGNAVYDTFRQIPYSHLTLTRLCFETLQSIPTQPDIIALVCKKLLKWQTKYLNNLS
jgi:hypothetical protein